MSGGITVVSYPSRFIKLAVFFEPISLCGFCPRGGGALSGWYCWACETGILCETGKSATAAQISPVYMGILASDE